MMMLQEVQPRRLQGCNIIGLHEETFLRNLPRDFLKKTPLRVAASLALAARERLRWRTS